MGDPRLTVVGLRQIEKMIDESGTPFTFLRPNFFIQNFVNFHLHTIKEQGAFYQFMVDSPVSLVDVRDIAAVAVRALTNNKDSKHRISIYYYRTGSGFL